MAHRIALGPDDLLYFNHVPKTAGTTFGDILADHFDPRRVSRTEDTFALLGRPLAERASYQLICGHHCHSVQDLFGKEPVYVTMLRDPVEQVLSQIGHIRRDPSHWLHEVFNAYDLDVALRLPEARAILRSIHVQAIGTELTSADALAAENGAHERALDVIGTSLLPGGQPAESADDAHEPSEQFDRFLKVAKERLANYAFVGIVERMHESITLLHYTLGWSLPAGTDDVRLNTNASRPRAESLPPTTLALLLDLTRHDRELYAFGLELFRTRFAGMARSLLLKRVTPRTTSVPTAALGTAAAISDAAPAADVEPVDRAIDLSQRLWGFGWRGTETSSTGQAFQWTATPDARVMVGPLPALPHEILVSVHAAANSAIESLTVLVNDMPLASAAPVPQVMRGLVGPDHLRLDANWLTVRVPRLAAPPGTAEPLGVCITGLRIRSLVPTDRAAVDFANAVPGSGWRGPERGASGRPFQWTIEHRAVVHLGPMNVRHYGLRIGLHDAITDEQMASVHAEVNGQAIALAVGSDPSLGAVALGSVSAAAVQADPLDVTLAVIVPYLQSPGGQEPPLGIALHMLELLPL